MENWAIWRDAGYWDRFRTCWHDDGWMIATWIRGSYETFIEANIAGWDKLGSILHFLGGSTVYLKGDYAICETKITISQRGMVGTMACDVVCTGRFYDFIERRNGRWGIVLRQPIYEKDRIDPVNPTAQLKLDPAILSLYPEGGRHLCTIEHDEVQVRIVGAGICHTDVKMAGGYLPLPLPVVLGHEGTGTVTAVGEGVPKVQVGDHVVLSFNSCGHCDNCQSGQKAVCDEVGFLSFGCERPSTARRK